MYLIVYVSIYSLDGYAQTAVWDSQNIASLDIVWSPNQVFTTRNGNCIGRRWAMCMSNDDFQPDKVAVDRQVSKRCALVFKFKISRQEKDSKRVEFPQLIRNVMTRRRIESFSIIAHLVDSDIQREISRKIWCQNVYIYTYNRYNPLENRHGFSVYR